MKRGTGDKVHARFDNPKLIEAAERLKIRVSRRSRVSERHRASAIS